MADVGDFLLENDQIRVNILGAQGLAGARRLRRQHRRRRHPPRPASATRTARAATASPSSSRSPTCSCPIPQATQVSVLKTASDGKEAADPRRGRGRVPVRGAGDPARRRRTCSARSSPASRPKIHFRTDYILRPGDRHVTIRHDARARTSPGRRLRRRRRRAICNKCEHGFKADDERLPHVRVRRAAPARSDARSVTSVFDTIFGDNQNTAQPKPQTPRGHASRAISCSSATRPTSWRPAWASTRRRP